MLDAGSVCRGGDLIAHAIADGMDGMVGMIPIAPKLGITSDPF
jgi:hypothetical protein